jgi:hypothetical protein
LIPRIAWILGVRLLLKAVTSWVPLVRPRFLDSGSRRGSGGGFSFSGSGIWMVGRVILGALNKLEKNLLTPLKALLSHDIS